MGSLQRVGDGVWIKDVPLRFLGIEIGTRMTVIRMEDGSLFIHSPVSIDPEMKNELDELGVVKHAVAPNRFHHLFVKDLVNAYPDAEVFAAPGLPEKRKDFAFQGTLDDNAPSAWDGQIDQIVVQGVPLMNETVFFHRATRTLILTDLSLNIGEDKPFLTRCMCWMIGGYKHFGLTRDVKYLAVRDQKAFRKSLDRIAMWDFDRIILAHGDIIPSNGKEMFLSGFKR